MPSQHALLSKPKEIKPTRRMDIVMFTCVAPTRRMDIVMATCVAPTRRMDIVMNPFDMANKHSDWGLSPVSFTCTQAMFTLKDMLEQAYR